MRSSSSLQTIYQPVPVEGALHHDLQIGFVGCEQLADFWQFVAPLLLHHYLQLFVDYTHVTISCTQVDSAVELHQRWPPFWRKVGKANAVYFVRFRPPLLIIKSLHASGGSVIPRQKEKGKGKKNSRRRVNSAVRRNKFGYFVTWI
jgi:hypothetical protein